ncbi:MAG: DUF2851 family protein [Bacteroidota bacterium]
MTEKLLQFIWQFQYFNKQSLCTVAGETLQVLQAGYLNKNQGPDFEQARITVNQTSWAGKVELHIYASDWLKHGHQEDERYNKVILHVVWHNDVAISDNNGNVFPTLELQTRVSNILLSHYDSWMQADQQIPCGKNITTVPALTWQTWKNRLLIERLQAKNSVIQHHLEQTNYHWEEVFWRMLCRYFGGSINGVSFEQVAVSLPIQIVSKHKNQIHQLEALLLGQAGLLHKNLKETYPKLLYREYQFFQKKYLLRVINLPPSFLRMRPVNFPTVRLAQLAMLIQKSQYLFSKIRDAENTKDIKHLFDVTANDYWNYHYRFDEEAEMIPKRIGSQMFDTLVINAIVPVLFSYGIYSNSDAIKEKAISWLEQVKLEKNGLVAPFISLGVPNLTAFDSQALLQLKKEYCDAKRCLECAVGNAILKRD